MSAKVVIPNIEGYEAERYYSHNPSIVHILPSDVSSGVSSHSLRTHGPTSVSHFQNGTILELVSLHTRLLGATSISKCFVSWRMHCCFFASSMLAYREQCNFLMSLLTMHSGSVLISTYCLGGLAVAKTAVARKNQFQNCMLEKCPTEFGKMKRCS